MMITIKGSRTSDGIYVLQSLITRQVNLGQYLIVCSVDFSKAFDLINGDTLFYKIITHDPHGRVIDTPIDLYRKTAFRIKYNGRLSPPIMQIVGVNQSASPSIFRGYISVWSGRLPIRMYRCLSDIAISDTILPIVVGWWPHYGHSACITLSRRLLVGDLWPSRITHSGQRKLCTSTVEYNH